MTTISERIRMKEQRRALERAYLDLLEWAREADRDDARQVTA